MSNSAGCNFKAISPVPNSKDLIDVILSKTQRKTPTKINPLFQIARIRGFYIRKVKFTQQGFHDRLTQILDEFPQLDDMHPFYADLCNILYDRDHFKLALGQLSNARQFIDSLSKDYVRLLKYGDSLYRCKQLKRAALGRMATLMLRQNATLMYLEQVRQHLSRLPSINPTEKTLLLTGFPNVGKSSLINNLSRANVDIQPYAFTTKSLFVGHFDFKYSRWQIIDTPGILDHSLDERNTIEMQAITALAHLKAAILFVVDVSEQCSYSLQQQADLFDNIRILFQNKPVVLVANKIDVVRPQKLTDEAKALLARMAGYADVSLIDFACLDRLAVSPSSVAVASPATIDAHNNICNVEEGIDADFLNTKADLLFVSTLTGENIHSVKSVACERLLHLRVGAKINGASTRASGKGASMSAIANRLHIATPEARDHRDRQPCIPDRVKKIQLGQIDKQRIKTRQDIYMQMGPEYTFDERWHRDLKNPEWQMDIIPEILDGKNIADYVDVDIIRKLEELEREEELWDYTVNESEYMAKSIIDKSIIGNSPDNSDNSDNSDMDGMDGMDFDELDEMVGDGDSADNLTRRLKKPARKFFTEEELELLAERITRDRAMRKEASIFSKVHRKNRAGIHRADRAISGNSEDLSYQTFASTLAKVGLDVDAILNEDNSDNKTSIRLIAEKRRARAESASKVAARSITRATTINPKLRERSTSRAVSVSTTREMTGVHSVAAMQEIEKRRRVSQRAYTLEGRKGEGDRSIPNMKPKHLYSGKRGNGTTDYR